ncbi:MAG: hypothetical protein QOD00_2550 [Blastocatellia bacterium]|jgi:hypothetical protein|nr:hypothetical protein [Blastocatellia bacterium]
MKGIPAARTERLIVREVASEVLVYDLEREKAHCLNRTAALVWKHCDGAHTAGEITMLVESELGQPINDDLVWLALQELDKFHLLSERLPRTANGAGRLSRRRLMLKYAPAALALPVIMSIVAPTAAQCTSAFQPGTPCVSPAQCCSGVCVTGNCA